MAPEKRSAPLSQKALFVLTRTPGVTCALVGMRQPRYVDDALAALSADSEPDIGAAYEAVRRASIV